MRIRRKSTKELRPLMVALFLLAALVTTPLMSTAAPAAERPGSSPSGGDRLAKEIAGAVGISISPILGLGVTGAWSWFSTPAAQRDGLPIHKQPVFWGPLLLILAGILLKDGAKGVGPVPKQFFLPADALELVLNKGGGLAGLALVVGGILSGQTPELVAAVHHGASAMAGPFLPATAWAADGSGGGVVTSLWSVVTAAVAGFSYAVVWLVSNTCNVLILLSPFRLIDAMLKSLRLAVLALIVGAAQVSPWLGALLSLALVALCSFVAARAFRLLVFGTLFCLDLLLHRRHLQPLYEGDGVSVFACTASGAPAMTYGRLSRIEQNGSARLLFRWRPWLVLPARILVLSLPPERCEVGLGTLSPLVMKAQPEEVDSVSSADLLFRLRPCCQGSEVMVAEALGIAEVQDVSFGRGVKAMFRWLKGEGRAAAAG